MSPFFSLCVDETTDVSVTKQLIVYGRYFCNEDVNTSSLGILELQNGLAVTITEALCKLCSDLKVDLQTRLCGLGSDGASEMLGNRGGVSELLLEKAPFLVATHDIIVMNRSTTVTIN